MLDTAAKTPTKKVELPKIKGRASEVLAAEPKASLRQLAADNTNKKTFKNISGVLDRFVSYSRTPVDRTTDIEIQSVQAETAEALETTSLVLNLSTKHIDEQNKLLEDILKVIKDKEKSSDKSKGGGSILDGLLDVLDGAGKKGKTQRKYSTEREKKARQRSGQTKSAVKPPATAVAKPPVSPARPTVPQVTAPPATSVAKPPSVLSSITEKIKSLKPSVSNIISGATSIGKGLATGAATDVALSSLTGRDEGLSSLALGFVPAAAGTVIATSGIKQAFAAAEALTPEERKGIDVRPETLDKILKNELNIEIVNEKELAPFKAGQVVSAQTIAKEYDISSPEELKSTIESLIKSGSGSNIKVKITTESEKESDAKPVKQEQIPIVSSQQESSVKVQEESVDKNKLIDRLKALNPKITNPDERTINRLQNITTMIQNNQLEEASTAITRLEKQFSTISETPLSDAFKQRQNIPQAIPNADKQKRSSLTDGSYQVASAQTTMTDATYITDEPEVKLASDVKTTGEKIVDPTGKSASVINETVKDINKKQIQKATDSVDKLKTEVKKQNKAYETLNDVMTFFGIKRKVAEQNDNTDTEDTPDTTPQVQATQNIQQLQSQVAQAPVSSGFSSGFSRMAGLAAGFMGATAAVASVGRPSRGGSSGVNRIAAGAIGSIGGAAVMGAMMQPQNLGAFGGILAGGSTGMGQSTPQERPSIAATGGAGATITGDDASIMAMIKEHEGYKTKPYKDSRGFWTVGVGHLIGTTLPPEMNREFTMEEVDQLFAKDYAEHKQAAMQIPGFEKLNPSGKGAVIDLTFNMGPAWYKKFPGAAAALAKGDMETFANEMQNSAWYTQVGRRGPKIVAMLRGGGQDGAMQASQQNAPGAQLASASTSMEAADQAQMRGAGQALQGTTAPAPSTGPQGMQMPPSVMGMGEIPINIRLRQLQS